MELTRVQMLYIEFTQALIGCGDVEYIYLNQIRRDLAAYIEAIEEAGGVGKLREGYQEKQLEI